MLLFVFLYAAFGNGVISEGVPISMAIVLIFVGCVVWSWRCDVIAGCDADSTCDTVSKFDQRSYDNATITIMRGAEFGILFYKIFGSTLARASPSAAANRSRRLVPRHTEP